jgi:hypothetical protein
MILDHSLPSSLIDSLPSFVVLPSYLRHCVPPSRPHCATTQTVKSIELVTKQFSVEGVVLHMVLALSLPTPPLSYSQFHASPTPTTTTTTTTTHS